MATREHEPKYLLLSPDEVKFWLHFRNPVAPATLWHDLSEERRETAKALVRRLFDARLLGAPETDIPQGDDHPPLRSPVPLEPDSDSRQHRRRRTVVRGLQERLRRIWDEISLAFVYAVAICPAGMALRALGRDPLRKRPDPRRQSYWTPITLTGRRDRSRYRQPW